MKENNEEQRAWLILLEVLIRETKYFIYRTYPFSNRFGSIKCWKQKRVQWNILVDVERKKKTKKLYLNFISNIQRCYDYHWKTWTCTYSGPIWIYHDHSTHPLGLALFLFNICFTRANSPCICPFCKHNNTTSVASSRQTFLLQNFKPQKKNSKK